MMIVHPGRALRREIEARGLSANALALALRTPSGRITDILNGKRGISPETALRLGRYFGNGARFWLNLQMAYELAVDVRVPMPGILKRRAEKMIIDTALKGLKTRAEATEVESGGAERMGEDTT